MSDWGTKPPPAKQYALTESGDLYVLSEDESTITIHHAPSTSAGIYTPIVLPTVLYEGAPGSIKEIYVGGHGVLCRRDANGNIWMYE